MKLNIDILKTLIENSSLDYRKKNVIGKCPYCGGDEFGISIDVNHKFGCFRKSKCGETGNIFKLLKKLNRLDLINQKVEQSITSNVLENVIISKESKQILNELPEISIPIGFKRTNSNPYLNERGFQYEDYIKYEVGTTKLDSKLKDYVIFIIRDLKKRPVAYVGRHTKSKEELKKIESLLGKRVPRYKNSESDFQNLLFGDHECTLGTDTAILVEGLFAKRKVDEALKLDYDEKVKCLCTFGAKISSNQILKLHLLGIENIILCYDPDVIGHIKKYSLQLLEEFSNVKIASLIRFPGKDPADLSTEELWSVFENLESVINFQLNTIQILNLR